MPGLFVSRPLAPVRPERRCAPNSAQDDLRKHGLGFATKVKAANARVCPLPNLERDAAVAPYFSSNESSHGKTKQVSEPLGASIRASICDSALFDCGVHRFEATLGCSSGSEHEPSSVNLAAMVSEFMEEQQLRRGCGRARCNCTTGSCSETVSTGEDQVDDGYTYKELANILQGLTQCASPMEHTLWVDVTKAMRTAREDLAAGLGSTAGGHDSPGTCLKRAVMARLRTRGYNAAICKSRWDHTRGFPGGDYIYIDVVVDSVSRERLIVDVDFRGQFQIARPTPQYSAALQMVPHVFVGRPDRLQQLVDIMSDATKWSLKSCGMHLPPWRKTDYMRAKWLSSYKRTTNEVSHAQGSGQKGVLQTSAALLKAANGSAAPPPSAVKKGSTTTQEDPTLLDMDIGADVDAVIYRGKVFPACKFMRPAVAGQPKGRLAAERNDGPEGMVRGGNRIPDRLQSAHRAHTQTGLAIEWQPPQVKPRVSEGRSCVRAGLAAVLKEAGLARQQKASAEG